MTHASAEHALQAELSAAQSEVAAWKAAHGPFGPQSPAEVAVFEQRAKTVEAEQRAHEQALHEAEVAELRRELSDCMKRSQHNYECSMRDAKRAYEAESRPCPREILERLAHEVSLYAEMFTHERERTLQWPDKVMPLVLAYRAATTPLRTREEVDAEILPLLRQHVARIDGMTPLEKGQAQDFHIAWDRIKELCRELTSDPGNERSKES